MKPDFQLRPYNPNRTTYAPRISDADWEKHKQAIWRWHCDGVTRPIMIALLAQNCGFFPTLPQLNAKMAAWKFKVYGANGVRHEDVAETLEGKSSLLRGMAPAVHFDAPTNKHDILINTEFDNDNTSDDNVLPDLNALTDQLGDDLITFGEHYSVDLFTLDLQNWERMQLKEFSTLYKLERTGRTPLVTWRMGYDDFKDAMDIKMGLKAPPKSLSYTSQSSWSLHRAAGYHKSSVTTSVSDTSRRQVKKVKFRTVDEALDGLDSLEQDVVAAWGNI